MVKYRCLACGRTVDMADGDEFPRDDERCSHEFEEVDGLDLSPEGEATFRRDAGEYAG